MDPARTSRRGRHRRRRGPARWLAARRRARQDRLSETLAWFEELRRLNRAEGP